MLDTINTATSFIFFILIISSIGYSKSSDSTLIKLEKAKVFASKIEAYNFYSENPEPYIDYNDSLSSLLINALTDKNVFNYNLEKIFKNSSIYYTQSSDNKLHILNWFANYGGSFKMYFEIQMYKPSNGEHRIVLVDETVKTERIYTLKTKRKETIYLVETFGRTCNTCIEQFIYAYSITANGLEKSNSCFEEDDNFVGIEARLGNIIQFTYSEKNKTLIVEYVVDDLSKAYTKADEGDTVKLVYRFNGNLFLKE